MFATNDKKIISEVNWLAGCPFSHFLPNSSVAVFQLLEFMTGIDVFMTFLIFLIDDPRLALIYELYVVLATIFMQCMLI